MPCAPLPAHRVPSHRPEDLKCLQTLSVHPAHPLCLNADPTAWGFWPGRGDFYSPVALPDKPSVVPRCSESRVCPLMRARGKRCSFSVLGNRKSNKIVVFSRLFPCPQQNVFCRSLQARLPGSVDRSSPEPQAGGLSCSQLPGQPGGETCCLPLVGAAGWPKDLSLSRRSLPALPLPYSSTRSPWKPGMQSDWAG